MKTLNLYLFVTLIAFISCKRNENHTQEKSSFEIYETIAQKEVPINLIEEFQQMNMQLNTDTLSPIIAFVPVAHPTSKTDRDSLKNKSTTVAV